MSHSHFVTDVLHSAVKVMLPSFKKGLYTLICNLLLITHGSSYVGDLRFHIADHQATWLKAVYYKDLFFFFVSMGTALLTEAFFYRILTATRKLESIFAL